MVDHLSNIKTGKTVEVVRFDAGYRAMKRLNDMGIIPGEILEIIKNSVTCPVIVKVKGTKLVIGRGLAMKVIVEEV